MKVESGYECPVHKVHHAVEIRDEDKNNFDAWAAGKGHIQDRLPHLSPADRETLLTGMCQESWNSMFPPEECDQNCDGSGHPGLFCK